MTGGRVREERGGGRGGGGSNPIPSLHRSRWRPGHGALAPTGWSGWSAVPGLRETARKSDLCTRPPWLRFVQHTFMEPILSRKGGLPPKAGRLQLGRLIRGLSVRDTTEGASSSDAQSSPAQVSAGVFSDWPRCCGWGAAGGSAANSAYTVYNTGYSTIQDA